MKSGLSISDTCSYQLAGMIDSFIRSIRVIRGDNGPSEMTLTVQLFAKLRDIVAASHVVVELPTHATVKDLRLAFVANHPNLVGLLDHCRVAVNHDFAEDSQVLTPTDEVAVIPPVSGG